MIDLLARRFHAHRMTSAGPDPRFLAFARGLALGALVGAVIAGSSIWKRRRRA